MLSLFVLLTVAAGPRGLEAKNPTELVTTLDARLPQWLEHKGDRKALLAKEPEIREFLLSLGVQAADARNMVKAVLKEQADAPELKQFTADRALVTVSGRGTTVSFFDAAGKRCEVSLAFTGKPEAARYVLLGGPLTDDRKLDDLVKRAREESRDSFAWLEKKDGVWKPGTPPAPPPPDCTALLTQAAKAVYVAQKSYYAEFDRYETSLEKVGVDTAALAGAKVTLNVAGTGETATFTAEVSRKGGVARVTDRSGEPVVEKRCTE